jgi:radical SAM protein with 4Fe4S-binding SPASM domain
MIDAESHLQVVPGVRIRKNFESWFIYKTSRFLRYETNHIGVELLRLCNGISSFTSVVEQAVIEYNIDKRDVIGFLTELVEEGVLKLCPTPELRPPKVFNDIGPSWVVLHITNQCNLRCKHCYVDATKQNSTALSFDKIKETLAKLERMGAIDVIVTGGEPFLHPKFVETLDYIRELGMSSEILTNGTLITADIACKLADIGVTQVLVSLDSSLPTVHDMLRGVEGVWEAAVRGIHNLKNAGVKVIANTVVCRYNLSNLQEMFPFLSKLGVDVWRLGTLFYVGRAAGNDMISVSIRENMEILQQLDEIYLAGNWPFMLSTTLDWEALAFSDDELAERKHICGMTMGKHLYIRCNGDVLVCDRLPDLVAGNIYREELSQIWEKELISRWKKNSGVDEIQRCGKCKWKYLCGAGCRANAFRYGDGYFEPDPIACEAMSSIESNWHQLPPNVQERLKLYLTRAEDTGATVGVWSKAART